MALVTESAGRVRQKATNFVFGGGTGTATNSISPYHYYGIKALFLHIAANKGNPDLQYVPYTAEQTVVNSSLGFAPDVDAVTMYAWFGKGRRTSGTTASFLNLYDATVGGDTDVETTALTVEVLNITGQQFLFVWPNGKLFATDIVLQATTTIEGGTESAAADSADGFFIIGA